VQFSPQLTNGDVVLAKLPEDGTRQKMYASTITYTVTKCVTVEANMTRGTVFAGFLVSSAMLEGELVAEHHYTPERAHCAGQSMAIILRGTPVKII
jgi:hypothetical protein